MLAYATRSERMEDKNGGAEKKERRIKWRQARVIKIIIGRRNKKKIYDPPQTKINKY